MVQMKEAWPVKILIVMKVVWSNLCRFITDKGDLTCINIIPIEGGVASVPLIAVFSVCY